MENNNQSKNDTAYYYMQLKEDFFEGEDMKLLESMENGYLYSNILLKMYLLSLKAKGRLYYKDMIPYSPKMIATLTGHNLDVVNSALEKFTYLGLIEVLDNGAIYMNDIEQFIGKKSTEALRKSNYRARINKEKKDLLGQCPTNVPLYILNYNLYIINKDILEDKLSILLQANFSEKVNLKIIDWLVYKKEKRQTYKEMGFKQFVSKLENELKEHTEEEFINAINTSMSKNYQGYFYEKNYTQQNKQDKKVVHSIQVL